MELGSRDLYAAVTVSRHSPQVRDRRPFTSNQNDEQKDQRLTCEEKFGGERMTCIFKGW